MSKRILSVILFSWLSMAASTAFAQQTDTADSFRFVPQEDTFYLPREDNPQESVQSLSPTISQLSLRANLLRWATLTPDLGLEWRFCPSWGIAVNGLWTSWSWNDKDRRYALWEVVPEIRYYLGREKRGYLGAMLKTGQFNYKLSTTGRQGDLMGGGLTGGYQIRLDRTLSLDFSMGVGYIHADYDKYVVIDGVRVRRGDGSKNIWGVNHLGVSLVWNIF